MKLTAKFLFLFLFFSILPMSVIGYLSYLNSRTSIEQSTIHHLTSINQMREAELERWINGERDLLRSIAARPLIREYAAVMVSADADDIRREEAYTKIHQEHFTPSLKTPGGFMELFILRDSDAKVMVSSHQACEGKYRESEPYFIKGKDDTFVQNPYYDLSREQAVMTVSTPIRDRDGTTIAVMAGHLDLTELSEIMLNRIEHHETDNEGTYLVNKFNFLVTGSIYHPEYAFKKAIHSEGVEKALAQNEGVGIYEDYRGVSVLGAYQWMPRYEMAILTEIEKDEAFAPIRALRNTVWILLALTALIVVLLGSFFTRSITGPIHKLVQGVTEFGRGNFDFRVETKAKDEVGVLTRAFNQMVKSRQKAEAELIKSGTYIDSMGDALIVLDTQRRVIKLNKAAMNLVGYSGEEIPGLTFEKLFPPKEHAKHFAGMQSSIKGGPPTALETLILTKSGQEVAIQLTGTALKDERGEFIGLIGVCSDITQRKQMEEELSKHRDHLEELVETKTAELRQSQSQLIEVEKLGALGTLTAGIAHEMNNPMMGILNFVQYCLKHTAEDDRRYDVLQSAERSTYDCIKIVQNLLTFSRIEKADEEAYEKESLEVIIERVLNLLAYRIEKENVSLTRDIQNETPEVRVKVSNIQQVFLNIIGNALDASKEGRHKEIKIDIRPEGGFVNISVCDSGPGIKPEHLPKIFDPFFTTKPVGKGTGLGLSVSKGIVDGHAGKIICTSELGAGARFEIMLPIERQG